MSTTIRQTPYELAFPPDPFETEVFPAIREEASSRGVSTEEAEQLLMLATVGNQLRELRPDSVESDDSMLPPAQAVRQYGALLFQAFQFWDTGCRVLVLEAPLVRAIADDDSSHRDWQFETLNPAGYVQLPRHLIWGRIDEDAPAEAVDGFFWSTSGSGPSGTGRLELLLVLGMHPARPGFSVIEAAAPLPPPEAGNWADIQARDDGSDFQNILPGGELRGLLALTSVREVLKFVSRIFHYIAMWPESVEPAAVAAPGADPGSHDIPPSALAASLVRPRDGT